MYNPIKASFGIIGYDDGWAVISSESITHQNLVQHNFRGSGMFLASIVLPGDNATSGAIPHSFPAKLLVVHVEVRFQHDNCSQFLQVPIVGLLLEDPIKAMW